MPKTYGTELIEHQQQNQEKAETILRFVFTPLDSSFDSFRYGVFRFLRYFIEKYLQVELTYNGGR